MSADKLAATLTAMNIDAKVAETLNDTVLVPGNAYDELRLMAKAKAALNSLDVNVYLRGSIDRLLQLEKEFINNPEVREAFLDVRKDLYKVMDKLTEANDGKPKYN